MYLTQNRMVRMSTFSGILILLMICTAVSTASPQLPCEFYGPVTINGAPAPVGTVITAYVNNVKQGSIAVKEPGRFGGIGTFDERLIVLSGENDFTGGAPMITFKIGDKVADQTSPYAPGTSTEISLSSGGGAVVITPVPTTVGTPTAMQVASVESVSQPVTVSTPVQVNASVPVVPVVTATPVVLAQVPAAPVVPVVTAAPVPQTTVSILSVSTPVVTPVSTVVPQSNQTVTPSVQQNVTPVPVPVVTAAPVVNVTATPVPTQNITPISTPVVNQTPAIPVNATNTTPVPGNKSVTVAFPSGQSVSQ